MQHKQRPNHYCRVRKGKHKHKPREPLPDIPPPENFSEKDLFCNICMVTSVGWVNVVEHEHGTRHKKALKRLGKPKPVPPPGPAKIVIKSKDRDFRDCKYCKVRVFGEKNVILHENGKSHQKKMRQLGIPITERVTLPMIRPAMRQTPLPSSYEPIAESERYMDLDMYVDEPFVGVEYLVEMQQHNSEPRYHCVLCDKWTDPRSVLTHIPSMPHRMKYFDKHFPTMLKQLKQLPYDKETMLKAIENVAVAVENQYGRLKPLIVSEHQYSERYRSQYRRHIRQGYHFSENCGPTFADLVHTNMIETLRVAVKETVVETEDSERTNCEAVETSSRAEEAEAPITLPMPEPENLSEKPEPSSFANLEQTNMIETVAECEDSNRTSYEAVETTSCLAITEEDIPMPIAEPERFMDLDLDMYMKKPFVGVEYMVEIHHEYEREPRYHCVLCQRWDDPRSILIHLPGLMHRINYIRKHYPTVMKGVSKFRSDKERKLRLLEAVATAVEKHHGRMKPLILWNHQYTQPNRLQYQQQIMKGDHFSEESGPSFAELVDKSRIEQLQADVKRTLAEGKLEASQLDTSSRSVSPMTRLRQHRQLNSDNQSRSSSLSPDRCSREDVDKLENCR